MPDSIKETIHYKDLSMLPVQGSSGMDDLLPETPDIVVVGESLEQVSQPLPYATGKKIMRQEHRYQIFEGVGFIKPRNEVTFSTHVGAIPGLQLPQRTVNNYSYDWITPLLLVALALFASVRTTWSKYLTSLFHSTVNYSTALRMYQEKNSSMLQGAFQLDLLFYIVFAVFSFQVVEFFRIELPYTSFYLYLFCLVVIFMFLTSQRSIYWLFGKLIEKSSETGEYLFNAGNYRRVTGLILLPLVAIIAFYPYGSEKIPVYTGISIVVFLYSLLVLRGFIILLRKQYPLFYLFLYFCTLEFLPLVLLFKILVV